MSRQLYEDAMAMPAAQTDYDNVRYIYLSDVPDAIMQIVQPLLPRDGRHTVIGGRVMLLQQWRKCVKAAFIGLKG
jgi:hypothetical protein